MTGPRESELKLDLPPEGVETWRAALAARFGAGRTRRLRAVYFDTPDHALRSATLTLRVREAGGEWTQTVKAGGGLFGRDEWETALAGQEPDLHALSDTPVAALLGGGAAPAPVFETDVSRTVWTVEAGGGRVEVALDEGEVRAGGRAEPVAELELELKDGSPEAVFVLADAIDPGGRLAVGVRTKAERGYALTRKASRKAVKAEPVPLEAGMSTAEGFAAILGSCLRQMQLNAALMMRTRGAEPLHQYRVGLRRLRSALALFGSVVAGDGEGLRLKGRLKDLSGPLGDARDLDVYLHAFVEPEAARDPDEPGVAAYLAAVAARRETAYTRILAILDAPDHRRLVRDLLAWAEAGAWRRDDDPLRRALRDRPVTRTLAGILDRRRRAVKRKGRRLRDLDPEARHQVRIAAKKLRYAAEFATPLVVRPKALKRQAAFIEAMEALQDALGDLNDIRAGHDLALRFAREATDAPSPSALFAAGHVSGQADERAAGLLDDAVAGHRAVAEAEAFWKRWRG